MLKPAEPRDLAIDILERSRCSVQVGAVVTDASRRIISWGWNSEGFDGLGLHAEAHALLRANKSRLWYGTIYVASKRARNGKVVTSKPCAACQKLIDKYKLDVVWRNSNDHWIG